MKEIFIFLVIKSRTRYLVVYKTMCSGSVESHFKYVEPLQEPVENDRKMMWMREVMKQINMLSSIPSGHALRFYWTKSACVIHSPIGASA